MKFLCYLSIITMIVFFSCNSSQKSDDVAENVAAMNPDSLIKLWNEAWNSTDSLSIAKMFSDQSQVVFSTKERMIGRDSIMINWVNKNLPMVRNLKTNKYITNTTRDMVYYAGDYSLDIVRNDSVIGNDLGCFTAIWKNHENKEWSLDLLFFGNNK